jgi:hypothetical protein
VIPVDRTEDLADTSGADNRWMVPDDDRRQGAAQIGAHVAFGAAGGNGVAEDLAALGPQSMSGLVNPSGLNALQGG